MEDNRDNGRAARPFAADVRTRSLHFGERDKRAAAFGRDALLFIPPTIVNNISRGKISVHFFFQILLILI